MFKKDTFNRDAGPSVLSSVRAVGVTSRAEGEGTRYRACLATENYIREYIYNWDSYEYEVVHQRLAMEGMDTARMDAGLPLLRDHRWYSIDNIYGTTRAYEIVNGDLIADLEFSSDETKRGVIDDIKNDIIRNFSISFNVLERTLERESDTEGKFYKATRWEALEVSIVPVPADAGATSRSALEQFIKERNEDMKRNLGGAPAPENTGTAPARGAPAPATTAAPAETEIETAVRTALEADRVSRAAAPAPAAPAPAAPAASEASEVVADSRSLAEYAAVANTMGLDCSRAEVITIISGAAEEQSTLVELTERLLKIKPATMTGRSQVTAGEDTRDKFREGVQRAILHNSMPDKYEIDEGNEYRSFDTLDIVRECLENAGINHRSMSKSTMISEALSRSFHTTSDFPLLMSSVIHTTIVDGYQEETPNYQQIARRTTNQDFRVKNTISMGALPELLKVNENGEYKRGTFSERGEGYALATFGRIIPFTRQALINDQTGQLLQVARGTSAQVSRLHQDIVWGRFLGWDIENAVAEPVLMRDGFNVYSAEHFNLDTGAASVFGKAAISNARTAGRRLLVDNGGSEDNRARRAPVTYDTMIVPPELEDEAEELTQAIFTAAQAADATPEYIRKMAVIVEPRLEDLPGGQIRWFMIDSTRSGLDYAFLAGESEVMTDTRYGFEVDGIEYKVGTDFGSGFNDHSGVRQMVGG